MMNVQAIIPASDLPIKSVKIFSTNEAEVTRVIPLDFTQFSDSDGSQVTIEISKLPRLLRALRARVISGSDDLRITDYYHNRSSDSQPFGSMPNFSSNVLRDLKAECTCLEDERQLRKQSFAFLSTYMNSLAQGKVPSGVGPAQLVTLFDEFVEIGKSRSAIIAVLDQQISDIQEEIKREVERLQLEYLSLATTATVVLAPVSGRTARTAELELVYRVNATWKPVYQIHVTTIDGVPSSTVDLTYRCQISQCTEENWDNVELMVTTAKPDVPLVEPPEPKKMEIKQRVHQTSPDLFNQSGFAKATPLWNTPGHASPFRSILSPPPTGVLFGSSPGATHVHQLISPATEEEPAADNLGGQPTTTSQGLFGCAPEQSRTGQWSSFGITSPSTQSQASLSTLVDSPPTLTDLSCFGNQPAPNAQFFRMFTALSAPAQPSLPQHGGCAVLAELEEDVTHAATEKVFIPSRVGVHHVLIATVPLKASITRVAVPSVDASIFYTCEILNTSNYVIPPGTVHTYLDGRHVSNSKLTTVDRSQTIQCALGVDPAMTTQFKRTVSSLPSFAAAALNHKAITRYTTTITIENTHNSPISDVIVRTSLPHSTDPGITITFREPVGLADIDSGTVQVREGCYARWSTVGNRAGENGRVFEWVCNDVKPGSEVLKAVWDANLNASPRDLRVVEHRTVSI